MLVSTGAEIVTGHKLLWPHDLCFFFLPRWFPPIVTSLSNTDIEARSAGIAAGHRRHFSSAYPHVSVKTHFLSRLLSRAVMQGVVKKAAICHNSAYIVQHNVLTVITQRLITCR